MYAPRTLRPILLTAVALLALARPAGTCGPSFPEAVFVRRAAPAVPYPRYVAGDVGVLQPTYPLHHLVIAYNILSGHPLSPTDQAEAVQLNQASITRGYGQMSPAANGLAQWIQLREAISLPGSGIAPPFPNSPAPPTIDTERQVPGQDYESFTNCLDDAFRTAALTLQSRQEAHGPASPEVLDWVRAQDDVFSNCAGARSHTFGPPPPSPPPELAPDRTPATAPSTAPAWLQKDRAYQIAAAHFYRTDYDTAASGFRVIAADPASPWQKPARYLIARALIRRATVGQISDIPPTPPGTPIYEAQSRQEAALQQQLPGRLREARSLLEAILKDPSMAAFHHASSSLLDLIAARLDPARQATVLAARLTSPTPPPNSTFSQNLIDLAYTFDRQAGETAHAEQPAAPVSLAADPAADLLAWLRLIRIAPPLGLVTPASSFPSSPPAPGAPAARAPAEALAAWQRTHSTPWLVAALTLAQPNSPGLPSLFEAARQTPTTSPGNLSVTYHRLRLTPASEGTRAEIAALLPTLQQSGDRSALNLFQALQSASSPTLESFLALAPRVPALTSYDGIEDDDPTPPLGGQLADQACGPKLENPPLFAADTATILNQRLPLRLLAEAAHSPTLPPNLRFQVAQSAWTRALLLNQPEIARSLGPILIACRDAWNPVLATYNDAFAPAGAPEAQQAATLLALMRFASTEPVVRSGEQRPDGFATYSQFRDNWWCGNQPLLAPDGKPFPSGDPRHTEMLFNQTIVPPSVIPDPPFLTQADRAVAAAEIAQLQQIPGAPDFFARETLAFFHAHPNNPRNADLLGQAERVVRNGCRSYQTRDLNHQLFTIVQTRYPNSEWARKYTSWE